MEQETINITNTILSASSLGVSICIAIFIYRAQLKLQEKQVNISLYKERYENIYLAFFDFITNYLPKDSMELVGNDYHKTFLEKFSYGRFLVKQKDYESLFNIVNKIVELHIEHINLLENIKISDKSEEEKNNEKAEEVIRWSKNLSEIEKLKHQFALIIMKYLQIEK